MKIENKEMLLYSMNKAYEELKCAMIEYNTNEKEVYFRLGSCLHWIMDCYERVKEIVPEEQKILFLSLAAANNAQKHLKEFEWISETIPKTIRSKIYMEIARRSTAKFENRKETVSREAAREKYYENINGSKKANRGLF